MDDGLDAENADEKSPSFARMHKAEPYATTLRRYAGARGESCIVHNAGASTAMGSASVQTAAFRCWPEHLPRRQPTLLSVWWWCWRQTTASNWLRSEEHTSELQSLRHLV